MSAATTAPKTKLTPKWVMAPSLIWFTMTAPVPAKTKIKVPIKSATTREYRRGVFLWIRLSRWLSRIWLFGVWLFEVWLERFCCAEAWPTRFSLGAAMFTAGKIFTGIYIDGCRYYVEDIDDCQYMYVNIGE